MYEVFDSDNDGRKSTGVSLEVLSAVVPETLLRDVDSSTHETTYTFTCGCVAVRLVSSNVSDITWCDHHARNANKNAQL